MKVVPKSWILTPERTRHEPIGRGRWNAAEEEVIAALAAPAADDVVALFEACDEVGNLFGIVLEVSVHGDDELALRVIEAGGESGGLAEVAAELDDQYAGVDGGYLFEQTIGAVAGTVVDEDELEALANLLHDGLEAVIERGDVLLFVVKRNDDGVFRHEYDDTPVRVHPIERELWISMN